MFLAKINWIRFEDGGMKIIPAVNVKNYPMIKLENDDELLHWSFVVENKEKVNDRETIAEVGFLMDNAPKYLLKKNIKFTLYEGGNKLVAYGEILN